MKNVNYFLQTEICTENHSIHLVSFVIDLEKFLMNLLMVFDFKKLRGPKELGDGDTDSDYSLSSELVCTSAFEFDRFGSLYFFFISKRSVVFF